MLEVGDKAPDFEAEASDGRKITLSEFITEGKKVILYFYPKDMTSGCTTEACDFRQYHPSFEEAKTVIIGVSKDTMSSHHKFIEKFRLPFLLISDQDLEIIKLYGVWKEKTMYGKKSMGVVRTTFLIDEKGIIRKIYSKVKVAGHVAQVLSDLTTI
ncbi:Peroxiredoxin [Desulfosporosinus acidiphilus SJ4]|uniref:thioredoxin-dependent peroxiredoxin n=1 Tax=Desulfosporosinus acidiphilus (strain DSM 22704 / JCM 16185 / SJ4) TaxID=646529 RepID=I4D0N9_DESAJ|nr:thioredoxin-dependent thiol peroxidase [Desulfosporosinus acidiphilus]AFM39363.1 Peroxiredoxin [Desulfosporosinus acidiphilus SJ4]